MSLQYNPQWLDAIKTMNPAALNFIAFCKIELHRRHNMEENFDEKLYEDAAHLVLRKLGALEMEDLQ